MKRTLAWTLLSLAAVCSLGGCAGGGGIKGMAQAGPAGALAIVDETDKRLTSGGVAGVKISAETRPQNAPARVLATATSDASGKFSLSVNDNGATKDQVWIIAEKDGFMPLKAPIYLPPSGRVIIVVMNKNGK